MGANFQTLTYDGDLTEIAVKDRFDDAVAQSRIEDGHSYSGEIGMATGLQFSGETFEDQYTAEIHVESAAEKWGPAIAVRFKQADKEFWLIGAWCSS